MKITLNKYKSKNAVANFNLDFENGISLSFVELIVAKDKEFLTHQTQTKQADGSYKTKYHSYLSEELQKQVIPTIKTLIKEQEQATEPTQRPTNFEELATVVDLTLNK